MKNIFRVDGSKEIGMGHIVRCLALADELKDNKPLLEILFLTKYEEGREIIGKKGYETILTRDDEVSQIRTLADKETLLITDFLDTDSAYISQIKGTPNIKVLSIDNNTRLKRIDADILINASVFDEGEVKIIGLTKYYLGPKYVILRKEFGLARKERKEIKDNVGTILVMSGGADFAGESLILNSIKALEKINEGVGIHLIIGPAFPYANELNELLSKTTKHFDVTFNPPNLIEIMKNADMAITAAGITLYELAALGIPSIAIPQVTPETSHQEDIANAFEKYGTCVNLGKFPSNELIYEKTMSLMEDKSLRKQLSDNGKALVDGNGLKRVLGIIFGVVKQQNEA